MAALPVITILRRKPYPNAIIAAFPKEIGGLLLLLVIAFLSFRIAPSFLVLLKFALSLFVIVFIPGWAILHLAKTRLRFLDSLACSLVVGMLASTTVYWGLGLSGQSRWFFLWPAVGILWAGRTLLRRGFSRNAVVFPRISGPVLALLGLYLLLLVTLLFSGYFDAFRIQEPEGGFTVSAYPDDGLYHAAVAHELIRSIPPRNPLIAGMELNYSYFMDLLVCILHRGFELPVLDLIYRLLPLFWFGLLILSVFTCARHVSGADWSGSLCCFLVLSGGGLFNILPGLVFFAPGQTWEMAFHATTMIPLFYVNPMLPAVSIFYTGLFGLGNFLKTGSTAWLFLTAFLFGALTEYKLFGTAVVIGGLVVSGVFQVVQSREWSLLRAVLAITLFATPFLLYHALANAKAGQIVPGVAAGSFLIWSLDYWHLNRLASEMRELLIHYRFTFSRFLWFLLLFPAYFLGGLGIRVVALPHIFRQIRLFRPVEPMGLFLSCSFFVAFFLTFLFTITPVEFPEGYNNAVWFYGFGLHVATLMASDRIVWFLHKKRAIVQGVVIAGVLLLCTPSAIQFFWRGASVNPFVSASVSEAQAMDFLRKKTDPDAVILKDPAATGPGESFLIPGVGGRRVVLSSSYMVQYHAPQQVIRQRKEDIAKFFENPALNADILERYGVNYVWFDLEGKNLEWDEEISCSGETGSPCFLRRVYEGKGLFALYKVEYRNGLQNQ